MAHYGNLAPREPTVKIKSKGGPGRPRQFNPLKGAYEYCAATGRTVEFELPEVLDDGQTMEDVLREIRQLLRRCARWHGHGRPKIMFDVDAGIWQLTVRKGSKNGHADGQ